MAAAEADFSKPVSLVALRLERGRDRGTERQRQLAIGHEHGCQHAEARERQREADRQLVALLQRHLKSRAPQHRAATGATKRAGAAGAAAAAAAARRHRDRAAGAERSLPAACQRVTENPIFANQ